MKRVPGVLGMEQSISDHSATYIAIISNVNYKRAHRRTILIYKNADFDRLNAFSDNCNRENIINGADTLELATENFSSKFLSYIRECKPEKTITIRPRDNTWLDSLLCKSIRKNKRATRFNLKQRKQGDIEPFDNFVKDLRLIVMECECTDPAM